MAGLPPWLPDCVRPLEDPGSLDGLYVDWRRLREDLVDDDRTWDEFDAWASSPTGRRASEEDEERLAEMVPRRLWHGASNSELVPMRIALELAPGGLLGDGGARLDSTNRATVLAAIADLVGHPTLR